MSRADWIFHTTDATFETDVLARSRETLVVLDFWAEWCGPCRSLAPILEQLVCDYEGRVLLVKANVDEAPQTANRFGISSIPTLLAVLDGEVVDSMQGASSDRSLKRWLDNLLAAASLRAAEQLSADDPESAEQALRDILAKSPQNREATVALVKHLFEQDKLEECRQIIEQLEGQGPLEPHVQQMKATLELRDKSSLDVERARRAASEEPDNFPLQLALAEALVGQRQYVEEYEICLSLVARDRKRTGEQARALMVQVFQAMPDDPLTSEYRRKLSMALY
jgi:putative thioredoxin